MDPSDSPGPLVRESFRSCRRSGFVYICIIILKEGIPFFRDNQGEINPVPAGPRVLHSVNFPICIPESLRIAFDRSWLSPAVLFSVKAVPGASGIISVLMQIVS